MSEEDDMVAFWWRFGLPCVCCLGMESGRIEMCWDV